NRPQRIITAFEAGLKPLYAGAEQHSQDSTAQSQLEQALVARQQNMQAAPWQIEILSPSTLAYQDFSDPDVRLADAPARPAIHNPYLDEPDERKRAQGLKHGRGPISGETVYEANTTVLRLTWLHRPRLAIMAGLLRALGNPRGSYRQRALAHGY